MQEPRDTSAGSRPAIAGNPPAPDAELVQAARGGDRRAFVEIVARHQAMVCGLALGILRDFTASEDAAQEAFLNAWRKIHELREPERLRAWLAQLARNAARGQLRRRRGHDALDGALLVEDEAPAPDEIAASEEEAALVRDSLAKLPEQYRLPLVLFYREGRSVRAVAEALQISEDAVKQRLSRGREMLRDQVSGLIETVLSRTGPTAVFTMTVAAAIGALAAPAAVAGSLFAAGTAAAGAAPGSAAAAPLLTAMSTTKTSLITAALVAAVCVPVGYHVAHDTPRPERGQIFSSARVSAGSPAPPAPPTYEDTVLFAHWRQLHEIHGTAPESMPALFKAISEIPDAVRRRAFRAALIAEWVQVDATGGLAFFLEKGDPHQRMQFLEEWLNFDADAAVEALLVADSAWDRYTLDCLPEIARRAPARLAELAARLPASKHPWDTEVRDAFAIVAEQGLSSALEIALKIHGPNRDQALAGVAQVWARTDLDGIIAWAQGLPDGTDRDEIIRAALEGKAGIDPAAALDRVDAAPPGGSHLYFASTTGARVLSIAAGADFDATVRWLAAHPGRLGHEDLLGLAREAARRLNADPVGFMNQQRELGSLRELLPAISSALSNDASGQRATFWEWLKTQPEDQALDELRRHVLRSTSHRDPGLALSMVGDLPPGASGDALITTVVNGLLDGGSMLHRFDTVFEQAPERLRQPLLESAFGLLNGDTLGAPEPWIARLELLPEPAQARAVESVARAWAADSPEAALRWLSSLPEGESRAGAAAAVASTWALEDPYGAADWIATLAPGIDRDRSAESLALAVAESHPYEAWEWAASIGDPAARSRTAIELANKTDGRHAAAAQMWLQRGVFTPDVQAKLEAILNPKANL